jgi:hypothetical protein
MKLMGNGNWYEGCHNYFDEPSVLSLLLSSCAG